MIHKISKISVMKKDYVLVTAARNEEAYIEKTIQSVVDQTILPNKWVIVSDGSTDRTDEIVKQYEANHDFIQLLHRDADGSRNFGSKVYAIRAGIERFYGIQYDFIGNLDADVSFEPHYYERILARFEENPKLGIAGGVLFEPCGGKWIRQYVSLLWSVSGPIQMFRRQCYEDIGGYIPLQAGGEDATAEAMARMQRWGVRSFSDIAALHHRRTGTEKGPIFLARFHNGIVHHRNGNHPLFEVAKCLYRIIDRPYIVGSFLIIAGYCWSWIRRNEYSIPIDVIKHLRREQKKRLLSLLLKSN